MKKILLLTAGYGEGHNSAARGIRDGLRKISPESAHVELHDLFAETYGFGNDWARVLYMGMINRTPRVWRVIYRWLDRQERFAGDFRVFFALKKYMGRMLERNRELKINFGNAGECLAEDHGIETKENG